MTLTRRQIIQGLVAVPAATFLTKNAAVQAMMAPPGSGVRNLILVDLKGGNDGLNTVVPFGLDGGLYASEYRPTLGVPANQVLPIAAEIGLNPVMAALKAHFDAGRLGIVQGVGYPQPDFSHAVSQRVWQTGDPSGQALDGWLGRYLSQQPAPTNPDALAVTSSLTLLLQGAGRFVPAFKSLGNFKFPKDNQHGWDKDNRREAYEGILAGLVDGEGSVATVAQTGEGVLGLIDLLQAVPEIEYAGTYPDNSFSNTLQLVARLMASGIGMRHFHVTYGGFDTHSEQNLDDNHANRLQNVSDGLAALYTDLAALGLAQDTLIVVYSEFGRTVYENGSAGSDHGTVNPVLLLGDGVSGGLVNAHPSLAVEDLDEDGELPLQEDLRNVFGTVVQDWLGGDAAATFPGHTLVPLPLFA